MVELAFASIILGTMVAITSVPDDITTADALFLSGLYMTVALILPVAMQVRSDLTSALRIENVLMLGIVYWLLLDLVQSAYPFSDVNPEHVQMAFALIGGFALSVWAGASGRGWSLPRVVASTASSPYNTKTIYFATLIAFALGMAKFAIACGFDPMLMIAGLGMNRWGAPWARGSLGGTDAFLDHMQYFGYILPSLCVVLAMRVSSLNWRVLTSIIMSTIMVAFLAQSGGRRIIGVAIGAAIFTWATSRPHLRPKVVISVGVATVVLLMFMQEMLRYRNVGFTAWWAGDRPDLSIEYLHVDDNFLRLAQLIKLYPDFEEYALHRPIYHALSLPIPRVLWPGKPTSAGFDLSALVGKTGVALSCSIIGELYVSLGIWVVAAGGFMIGRLAGMWNKILLLPIGGGRALMYALGLMTLFAGMRSMQALVQMSYIVLAWIVVSKVISKSKRSMRAAARSRGGANVRRSVKIAC